MEKEKIKTLLVNILTGVVAVGVLSAGYVVFTKKEVPLVDSVTTVSKIAEKTASIGEEIDYTVKDLQNLGQAVSSSIIIFDLFAFKNLENFSVAIPTEQVGRTNPFTPTPWKLKMKTLESATVKSTVSPAGGTVKTPAPATGGI